MNDPLRGGNRGVVVISGGEYVLSLIGRKQAVKNKLVIRGGGSGGKVPVTSALGAFHPRSFSAGIALGGLLEVCRRTVLFLLLLSMPLWIDPMAWYLAYQASPFLSRAGLLLLGIELAFGFGALIAALVIIAAPVRLLFRTYRPGTLRSTGLAAAWLASIVGGIVLGREVWHERVTQVADRAEPLLAAIHEYAKRNGRPPDSLNQLIPDHMSAIPPTGIGAFPDFRYEVGQADRYNGNAWVLLVVPPSPPMGFDVFMYFPLQNYPEFGFGGSIERIGLWGYVHE